MRRYLPLAGRILLALIFLLSTIGDLTGFSGTQQYMDAYGMPATGFFLICAIIFKLVGGLSVLLGYRARIGAWVLVVFLIPATLIFHTNFAEQAQVINFLKNLAIMGGLLLIVTYGAGPLSLDGRRAGPSPRTAAAVS